jgi:anti-sigma regulatory factor (Ser/Thr protein kinase)
MTLTRIDGPVIVEVPSDPAALFLVRCVVERLTERMGFAREHVGRITLAVDEACTNVIRHAYRQRPGQRIVVRLEVSEDRLEIRIRDFGTPADPREMAPRDLGEIRPGGLGTHFIRCAMDEVHYESPAGGGGLLRLVKYREPREDARP